MLKAITIDWCLNGWKVRVGCQEVVFDSPEVLLTALRGYLNDPEACERRWLDNSRNARWTVDGVQTHAQGQTPPAFPGGQDVAEGHARADPGDRPCPVVTEQPEPGGLAQAPYLPEPVEQIIERLDSLERDTDMRLDHLSQRLDAFGGVVDRMRGDADTWRRNITERLNAQSGMLDRQHSSLTQQANKGDELERAIEGNVDDRLMELESAVRGLQADGRESE